MGEGFTWETQDRSATSRRRGRPGTKAKELIRDPANRMVLLDEINIVLRYDYLDVEEVVAFLKSEKPEMTHVVLTGRNAKEPLIEAADLVTEMELVKHPFRDGIKAQMGVEFFSGHGDLDQVPVRIAQVDRQDRPGGAAAGHWALFDRDAAGGQMGDPAPQRRIGQEAEVGGTGYGAPGHRGEGRGGGVQVDLLGAEGQGVARRPAGRREGDRGHAQGACVEGHAGVDVGDGQDQMVEPGEAWGGHGLSSTRSKATLASMSASVSTRWSRPVRLGAVTGCPRRGSRRGWHPLRRG